jgi:hypothetical protein
MLRPVVIGCLGLAMLSAHPAYAQQKKIRRQRNLITAEEIATRPGLSTAYDIIRNLRPAWLNTRGITSTEDPTAGGIQVYVDEVKMGGLSELQSISVDRIQELRFLSASDATMKYGTGNTTGAIEVTTKH